ncbi:IMP dehydrogenase [Candidatus Falkowbacteria bacterium]|nr:IMP dehydrogenase [Candidatus Falkowbacteria bacterium]
MKMPKDRFFRRMEAQGLALSYGDVRMRTGYSEVLPSDVLVNSLFSRNVPLNCPIISSPMDTVTERKMAIQMAKLGGLGIIHKGLNPKDQAAEVASVKFYLNGLIKKPICFQEEATIGEIERIMEEKGYKERFQSFPILDSDGKLVGLLTHNDFEFCLNPELTARQVMSHELIKAQQGIGLEEVFRMMVGNKKKVIPVVDGEGQIAGMYVYKDVKRIMTGGDPIYNLDPNGNLRVGAAIGVGEEALQRAELLYNKGVDVVVIDTAHGDTLGAVTTLKELKRLYPGLDVVVGNISEGESARRLAEAGADGLRIGQGPGSICTTRVVAGIGCPQVTAVYNCAKAVRGIHVPVCADGGIEDTGDITIAMAAGAHSVMLGSMLAGTDQAPGDIIQVSGMPMKRYRGMGSLGAMQSSMESRKRYGQGMSLKDKLVPEGVEGVVPYKGDVEKVIVQCLGGLRAGMGYCGARNVEELQEKADFHRISGSGLKESHPHGIIITEEAPNYKQQR